jgi:hypothetical protein
MRKVIILCEKTRQPMAILSLVEETAEHLKGTTSHIIDQAAYGRIRVSLVDNLENWSTRRFYGGEATELTLALC